MSEHVPKDQVHDESWKPQTPEEMMEFVRNAEWGPDIDLEAEPHYWPDGTRRTAAEYEELAEEIIAQLPDRGGRPSSTSRMIMDL